MPDAQKPRPSAGRSRAFKQFAPGGGDVSDADYELLGLTPSPPPTSAAIRKAFRAQAMQWHPDLQQAASEAQRVECHVRFQKLVDAHRRVRKRHPDYLDAAAE